MPPHEMPEGNGSDRTRENGTSAGLVASPRVPRAAEVVAAGASFAILMLTQVLAADGGILFTRPLWLDEMHTVLSASLDSPAAILEALRRGADFNPPLLHLLVWLPHQLAGPVTETPLRTGAFAATWLAVVTVYVLLRRDYSRAVAGAGALAVWAHPLTMRHAFDGRFYGPWLLFTVLYAALLSRLHGTGRRVAVALAAAALCSIHYYGIISWFLVTASFLLTGGGTPGQKVRRYLPAAAGPVAAALSLPLFIGQRAVVGGGTWVESLSWSQVTHTLHELAPPLLPFAVLAFLAAGDVLLRRMRNNTPTRPPRRAGLRDSDRLLVLVAMPVALLGLSVLAQPTMIARYGMPAVLVGAPLAARLLAPVRPAFQYAGLVALLLASQGNLLATRAAAVFFNGVTAAHRSALLELPQDVMVTTVTRHAAYPLGSIGLGDRVAYLMLPDTALDRVFQPQAGRDPRRDLLVVERTLAAVHQSIFGFPDTLSYDQARNSREIVVLGVFDDEVETALRWWLPGRTATRLAPGVYIARVTDTEATPGNLRITARDDAAQ